MECTITCIEVELDAIKVNQWLQLLLQSKCCLLIKWHRL